MKHPLIYKLNQMNMLKMTNRINEPPTAIKCKNCGSACTSNFCPDCGQSTKEKRLENSTFFIGMASGLSRINKGFMFTAWNLLIHPWKVIRDYIQCRRIRYVAPISMLVLVCFINAFVSALVTAETQPAISDLSSDNVPLSYRIILAAGSLYMYNALLQNLTIYLPALLAIPIVYGKSGAMKYNMAEYLTAMIYMAASFNIFNTIAMPVSMLSESLCSALCLCYSIVISAISLYFSFPMDSRKRRVTYFVVYLLTVLLIYLILLVILGIAIGIGGHSI